MLAITEHCGEYCKIWPQHSGKFRELYGEQVVTVGVPGCADLQGIIKGGMRIELEIKTATGRQEDSQKKFQAMIESMGGIYRIARTPEQAVDIIKGLYDRPA